MSARKIGMLVLLLAVGGAIETAWQVRGNWQLGPQGCRVMGERFYGPSYAFEQTAERPIGAMPQVTVRNAFGSVSVAPGPAGLVRARLRKVVYRPTQEEARAFADRIELVLSGDGSTASVETNRDALGRSEDVAFETHLELQVPPEAAVTVRNEHGRVEVAGIRSADVVSSFDGVAIERLSGGVKLDGRHGDLRVSDVAGPLELVSRHGGVELLDLHGPATIDAQHGDVSARRCGRLEIRQQHGAVTVDGVDGDLLVRAGHAQVEAHDVRRQADVETSFAGVELVRVGGDARVKVDHGPVSVEDVGGGATLETSYDSIRLDRVAGAAELAVHHGGIDASGLEHGVRVRASGGDVTLDGFAGPTDVELERGNARLSPHAAVTAPISVSVRNGQADLQLPQGSAVELAAESRRGEIRTDDVPGLAAEGEHSGPGPARRLSGKLGAGGVLVTLRADGDVTVAAQPAGPINERAIAKPDLATAGASGESSAAVPAEAPLAEPTVPAKAARPSTERERRPRVP